MPILTHSFTKTLHGLSGKYLPGKAWDTGKPLMDRMWDIIRDQKLVTEGINHWLYSGDGNVFVGVELSTEGEGSKDLEKKEIRLEKYAIWRHKGSFSDIPKGYKVLQEEIMKTGNREGSLSIEIYGHVTDNSPQSEMEVLIELQ